MPVDTLDRVAKATEAIVGPETAFIVLLFNQSGDFVEVDMASNINPKTKVLEILQQYLDSKPPIT